MTDDVVAEGRPRGRRRKDMPDGRGALLRAATRAFADLGYDRADLRGIARAAGVDPGLVRVHFGTKAGLWQACVDGIVAEVAPILAESRRLAAADQPVADRLRQLIQMLALFAAVHPEVRQFVAQHALESPERAQLLTDRLVRSFYESVRPLLIEGIAAGVIRVDHPVIFFSLMINALHQPTATPSLIHALEPEIAAADVPARLVDGVLAAFLNPSPFPARPSRKH